MFFRFFKKPKKPRFFKMGLDSPGDNTVNERITRRFLASATQIRTRTRHEIETSNFRTVCVYIYM